MTDLRVSDFDYDLPEELIAQAAARRARHKPHAGLDRATGAFATIHFSGLGASAPGRPARPQRQPRHSRAPLRPPQHCVRDREKPTGRIEVMLTEPAGENRWRALVRPGRKVAIGERLVFPAPTGEIAPRSRSPRARPVRRAPARVRSAPDSMVADFFAVLDRIGHMPLPPYIHRDDADADRDRYQTVFAASAVPWPRPPPACTSRHRCSNARRQGRRNRACHAPRRPRHLCAAPRRARRRSPSPQRALHHQRRSRRRHQSRRAERRRIVAVGTTSSAPSKPPLSRPGSPIAAPLRRNRHLHLARLRVPPRRRAAHQLPPAPIQPAHAGQRLRRPQRAHRSRPLSAYRHAIHRNTASSATATACSSREEVERCLNGLIPEILSLSLSLHSPDH
jgi:hypothetical protein